MFGMKKQILMILQIVITSIMCGILGGLLGSLITVYFIFK